MKNISFLKDKGEMSVLTREYAWENSSVGKSDHWPQSLRTTVAMILSSKFPMFLWWGEELIQFYNDAYRPSMGNQGKHPAALGQPGKQCWPEIWPTIKPLIDQVLSGQESVWRKNQLIPIYRNGYLEDVYWTFCYSPVMDDSDKISGVLVVCQETTLEVLAQKTTEQSEARFRSIVEQAPMAIGLLRGREMIIEVGNATIFEVWGKDKTVTGMRLIDALPELKSQGFMEILAKVYDTEEPFYGESFLAKLVRNGKLEDVYFDFVYTPLRNENQETTGIMILASEVTQQVMARQITKNSELRYRNLSQELDQKVQLRTQQLQTSVTDLERSNENLQQFAYIASHDLQEPLRKIQAFGDILIKRFSSDLGEGADYLKRMQAAASRMSLLIDDLLTFARIPTKQKAAVFVSIGNIVKMVLADLEIMVQDAGAIITVGQLPEILGEASQLGQLFQNLLSNALKFQFAGIIPRIQIDCQTINALDLPDSVKPSRVESIYYRINVTDNGIGFDNIYSERIFQVFQRLHGKNEFPGTGIGLSICEKIAVSHGGAITASSQKDTGTVFSVYFPA